MIMSGVAFLHHDCQLSLYDICPLRAVHIFRKLLEESHSQWLFLVLGLRERSRHVLHGRLVQGGALRGRLHLQGRLVAANCRNVLDGGRQRWRILLDGKGNGENLVLYCADGGRRDGSGSGWVFAIGGRTGNREVAVHDLDGLLGLLGEGELVGVLLQPRVELDDQVALVHFAPQIVLHLHVALARQRIVAAQVVVELLKDYVELLLEVLRLLRLRRPGDSELGGEVEGALEVLEDVGLLEVPEEGVHAE